VQSVVMNVTMFLMIHLCVKVRRNNNIMRARDRVFSGMLKNLFDQVKIFENEKFHFASLFPPYLIFVFVFEKLILYNFFFDDTHLSNIFGGMKKLKNNMINRN
jgi:hypothetical protein